MSSGTGVDILLNPSDQGIIFAVASLRFKYDCKVKITRITNGLPDQIIILSGPGFLGSTTLQAIPALPFDDTEPKRIFHIDMEWRKESLTALERISGLYPLNGEYRFVEHAQIDPTWTKFGDMRLRKIMFSDVSADRDTWGLLVTVYLILFPTYGGHFNIRYPSDFEMTHDEEGDTGDGGRIIRW